jgi:hypothetical protein
MVLAGGALTATACSGSTSAQTDATSNDAASNEVLAEGGDATAPGDDATSSNSAGGCCNADPDPCCPMTCSGVPLDDDAEATYLSCEAWWKCEDGMNGIYTQEPDGSLVCIPQCQFSGQCPPAPATPDAGDASTDADVATDGAGE